MKVAFVAYRDWANKIYEHLEMYLASCPRSWDFTPNLSEADVILFYGWSEMIPAETYTKKLCLILHPSPLPKYRGGSPLQHQIINGEKESAVTICRAIDKLDAGAIYSQTPLSLEGTLNDIFGRIIEIGVADTIKVLDGIVSGKFYPRQQDDSKATIYKRRKPEESELDLLEDAEALNNKIRALADPYPNTFIRCGDGKKLYITGAHL